MAPAGGASEIFSRKSGLGLAQFHRQEARDVDTADLSGTSNRTDNVRHPTVPRRPILKKLTGWLGGLRDAVACTIAQRGCVSFMNLRPELAWEQPGVCHFSFQKPDRVLGAKLTLRLLQGPHTSEQPTGAARDSPVSPQWGDGPALSCPVSPG